MALGKTLREARERRQLTLSQVASATRMKVQVVQALEAEDYLKVPAPIYGRGFIRMYAEFIGVDPKPLVAEYMAAISGPVEQPVPPSQAPVPGKTPKFTPPVRSSLTRMTPVARVPHQVHSQPVRPEPAPVPPPEPSPAFVPAVAPPPPPVFAPPPPPPEPEPIMPPPPLEQREPEPLPPPAPARVIPPATALRKEDDLFAWSQPDAVVPQALGEQPAPPPPPPDPEPEPAPEPEPEAEPIQPPVQMASAPHPAQDDVAPVGAVPTAKVSDEPEHLTQAEPGPVSPAATAPQQEDGDDLFAAAGAPALVHPPKTASGPHCATYSRRPPQRPEPGERPTLSSEREALKTRAIMVVIGVVVVTIFLISALSRCSPPPNEIKRGPVKEPLKMAVEPPAPYVD